MDNITNISTTLKPSKSGLFFAASTEDPETTFGDELAFSRGFPRHNPDMTPLGLIAIVVITLIGNLLVCVSVKLDKHLHHMTYYFFVSLAVVHILMATLLMPPAILILLAGKFTHTEEMCKLWITLELFFCNNTSLHLAFTNMDTFLRLKDPLRHGRTLTTCSILLWIGAPWMISFVQGIAQFMLSQGDHGIIHGSTCFIADKNFVILGTLFSFIIPTVISILFYGLCVYEIKALKGGKLLDESETASTHNIYRYGSHESIPEDMSDSTSCGSDHEAEREPTHREQVQLALVNNLKESKVTECINTSPGASVEEVTSFCEEQLTDSTTSFAEHLLSSDQNASCTLLLRDPNIEEAPPELYVRPNAENDHDSPDMSLRNEQAICRMMFVLLIAIIALWIPLSISNIVYGVCVNCRYRMTFDESNVFKWLAYSSSLIAPFLYGKFCDTMKDGYWNVLTCAYCRRTAL